MKTIYKGAWVVYGMLAAILWAFGRLGGESLVILGIAAFGLIYFGMMLVLPLSIKHPAAANKGERISARFRSVVERYWLAWNPDDTSVGEVSIASHAGRPAPTNF